MVEGIALPNSEQNLAQMNSQNSAQTDTQKGAKISAQYSAQPSLQNSAQKSIFRRILILFLVAFLGIVFLWFGVHSWKDYRYKETLRLNLRLNLQSFQEELLNASLPSDEILAQNGFVLAENFGTKNAKIIESFGDKNSGYQIVKSGREELFFIYTPINYMVLRALDNDRDFAVFDIFFCVLLGILALLFFFLNKALAPLNLLYSNLLNLKNGEFKILEIKSDYKEISRIQNAYNSAILRIKQLLGTREMFNKIFMHEMKTPLAKGAFYLKNAPSPQNQGNLARLFAQINEQLENFRLLESLVSSEAVECEQMGFGEVFERTREKLNLHENDKICVDLARDFKIYGSAELWEICLKNLIENALNYSPNHEIKIYATHGAIVFENSGEPLAKDISSANGELELNWKLDKSVRHKSSSGYGFGLFIIQKTAILNGYEIAYSHENGVNFIKFIKKQSD
ncbi:hypothetical protein OFO01_01100 [Campylobacter sp. JMF_01 NE2]|uniref:hypothetical protein n=1 Tax=Campylobacter sp. JMF_03 NE3 TaxID=2983831 RepID=UPI0022E9C3F5|nr:hypothetical protein [Campylobacter sp. JMF_03 NE3]MDA3052051.1 hypothetical protein [Campylobacter sp. JMF_03 NE3]MDA3066385.1 hypothetical protein [Campylobacter sp. JMF_01 NE2]